MIFGYLDYFCFGALVLRSFAFYKFICAPSHISSVHVSYLSTHIQFIGHYTGFETIIIYIFALSNSGIRPYFYSETLITCHQYTGAASSIWFLCLYDRVNVILYQKLIPRYIIKIPGFSFP